MKARTPSIDELARLQRPEWEGLCMKACDFLYSARRVEDRFGKGNGLDCWRHGDKGVEGWQFRRFEDRLGLHQENEFKSNMALACARSSAELKQPLVQFTAVFNIDPEPGHRGTKGEIERLADLKQWARSTHNLDFDWKGLSWVHGRLLENPRWKPELFEDVVGAVQSAADQVTEQVKKLDEGLEARFRRIEELAAARPDVDRMVAVLLREAAVHFERGKSLESGHEYSKAITSLEDALRLARGAQRDPMLEGEILLLLAAVEATVGRLERSANQSREAVEIFERMGSQDRALLARGNLGFALYRNQQRERGEAILLDVLRNYEDAGSQVDVVRTLTHLLEIACELKEPAKIMARMGRLRQTATALEETIGFCDLILAAMGSQATALLSLAELDPDPARGRRALSDAVKILDAVIDVAERGKSPLIYLPAKAQKAHCMWALKELEAARALFAHVAEAARSDFQKLAADCDFNRALVLLTMNRNDDALVALRVARDAYVALGDHESAEQARTQIGDLEE